MALYDELASAQTQLTAQGLRLRYAIVPYSTKVNVGKLVQSVNSSYLANQATYQSRTRTCDANGNNCVNTFGPKLVNVTSYLTGGNINANTIVGGNDKWTTWNGCIEERQTVNTITSTSSAAYSNIPSGALDLNIDKDSRREQRHQMGAVLPDVVYLANDTRGHYCPKEAKRLN